MTKNLLILCLSVFVTILLIVLVVLITSTSNNDEPPVYEDNNASLTSTNNAPISPPGGASEGEEKIAELLSRDEAIALLDDYRLSVQQKLAVAKEFQIGSEATFTEASSNTESVSIRLTSTRSSFRLKKGLEEKPVSENPFLDWTPQEYNPLRHDRSATMTFFVENRDRRKLEGIIFSYELFTVFGESAGSGKVVLTKAVQAGSVLLVDEEVTSPIYDVIEGNNVHSLKMEVTLGKVVFGD